MAYDAQIHRRRSIRLRDYDYSRPGWYYVTVCTKNRECILGTIRNDAMVESRLGRIVREKWLRTPKIRPNVELDEFVIMPNHVHGIVILNDDRRRGVSQYAPTNEFQSPAGSLGAIIRGFKSATTKRINLDRNPPGVPVWQRGFYEHIIRDDADLHRIRAYIRNNPVKWKMENPSNSRP